MNEENYSANWQESHGAAPGYDNVYAYAFASGHIGFTSHSVPDGALILAYGPRETVERTVRGVARLAYDNETLLVPGVPEAEDQTAAYKAFSLFFDRVQLQLGKHGIGQRAHQAPMSSGR